MRKLYEGEPKGGCLNKSGLDMSELGVANLLAVIIAMTPLIGSVTDSTIAKTESHIISHKACLLIYSSLQTILSSSHQKHVFLHAFDHKGSHILSPKHAFFSKALPQKTHIPSHTNHALFQRLFHRKFTHPLTQHMSFCMSSFNETKAAYVKELPRKVNPV